MGDSLNLVSQKIKEVVDERGVITLAELECAVNTSFNMLFLAVEDMVSQRKISLSKTRNEYMIARGIAEHKLTAIDHRISIS